MAVQTYSMRTDANTNVSEHFKVREFACNDGSDTVLIDDALVERLERIRGVFGSGITITSGYRTPSYNAAVGGAASSQHTKGTAADIQLRGVPPLAVANYVEETFSTGGIGVIILIEFIIFGKKEKREMFQIIGQAAFKAQLGNLMKRQMSIICIYFLKNNLI